MANHTNAELVQLTHEQRIAEVLNKHGLDLAPHLHVIIRDLAALLPVRIRVEQTWERDEDEMDAEGNYPDPEVESYGLDEHAKGWHACANCGATHTVEVLHG